MENEQIEYTVEYQDMYGVVYFKNVIATSFSEAKVQVSQQFPDVLIRAVTVVSNVE